MSPYQTRNSHHRAKMVLPPSCPHSVDMASLYSDGSRSKLLPCSPLFSMDSAVGLGKDCGCGAVTGLAVTPSVLPELSAIWMSCFSNRWLWRWRRWVNLRQQSGNDSIETVGIHYSMVQHNTILHDTHIELEVTSNLSYKVHQIPRLKCFLSRLAVVFSQSIETRC